MYNLSHTHMHTRKQQINVQKSADGFKQHRENYDPFQMSAYQGMSHVVSWTGNNTVGVHFVATYTLQCEHAVSKRGILQCTLQCTCNLIPSSPWVSQGYSTCIVVPRVGSFMRADWHGAPTPTHSIAFAAFLPLLSGKRRGLEQKNDCGR